MKKIIIIISAIILSFTLITCSEDEVYQRGYPKVNTIAVSDINASGATFIGEIFNYESLDIIEYGFLWSENAGVFITVAEQKILTNNFSNGKFSAKISSTLEANKDYGFRAYAKTADFTIYGNLIYFESKGSEDPEITKLEPSIGVWGDTIQIIGNNFSYLAKTNTVTFQGVEAEILESSDTVITCIVPKVENEREILVNVKIANSTSNTSIFTINTPVINSISTLKGTFRDEITVNGSNFGKKAEYNEFYFGNVRADVKFINTNTLKVTVPDFIESKISSLKLISNGVSVDYPNNFELLPPKITAINATSFFTGDRITIIGENFHPLAQINVLNFNNAITLANDATKNSIKTTIPNGPFSTRKIKATIQILDMEFEYDTEIEIKDEWLLVSDNLPFYKSEFGPANTVVANGNVYIIAQANLPFNDPNYGEMFLWKFNESDKTWSSESIPFQVDWLNWGDLATDGKDLFVYQQNKSSNFRKYNTEQKTWSAVKNFPGKKRSYITSFNIDNKIYMGMGRDFDLPFDPRYSDFYEYDSASDSWKKLKDFVLSGRSFSANFVIDGKVYLLGGAFTTGDTDCYAYNPKDDSWSKKADLNISFNRNTAFALNEKGYLVAQNTVYKYDPISNSWTSSPFIENDWRWREGNFSFSFNGKGYIGSGNVQNSSDYKMFEFKPI